MTKREQNRKECVEIITYNIAANYVNICVITSFCVVIHISLLAPSSFTRYIQMLYKVGFPLIHIDSAFINLISKKTSESGQMPKN